MSTRSTPTEHASSDNGSVYENNNASERSGSAEIFSEGDNLSIRSGGSGSDDLQLEAEPQITTNELPRHPASGNSTEEVSCMVRLNNGDHSGGNSNSPDLNNPSESAAPSVRIGRGMQHQQSWQEDSQLIGRVGRKGQDKENSNENNPRLDEEKKPLNGLSIMEVKLKHVLHWINYGRVFLPSFFLFALWLTVGAHRPFCEHPFGCMQLQFENLKKRKDALFEERWNICFKRYAATAKTQRDCIVLVMENMKMLCWSMLVFWLTSEQVLFSFIVVFSIIVIGLSMVYSMTLIPFIPSRNNLHYSGFYSTYPNYYAITD